MVQRSRRVVGAPTVRTMRVKRHEPSPHPLARSRRVVIPWVIAGLALATIVAALYRPCSRPPTAAAAPAVQAFIDFRHVWLMNPMLSPDGRYVSLFAFAGAGGQDGRTILVRRLADGQTTWLAGTEHALPLAWSPESRSLAVVVDGEIKAVDIDYGQHSDNRTST